MSDETVTTAAVPGWPELRLVGDATAAPAAGAARIRIVIVDDHPMIRDIVRAAAAESDRFDVVGEAATGDDALAVVESANPDVVILDLSMPGTDSFDVARRMQERSRVRIVGVAEQHDPESLFACRRAGIEGYFEKTETIDDLLSAVEVVAQGRDGYTGAQDRAANDALGALVRRARESYQVAASLTTRELEVLRCIVQGMTTRQVAGSLGISARTAESHIARLYRKLGVRTRVQAVVQATRLGLLDR